MIIQGLEFPDDCPENCLYKDDMLNHGQSAICTRCPVLNCQLNPADPENGFPTPWRILEPDDFRSDWLRDWWYFFKEGKEPELRF